MCNLFDCLVHLCHVSGHECKCQSSRFAETAMLESISEEPKLPLATFETRIMAAVNGCDIAQVQWRRPCICVCANVIA